MLRNLYQGLKASRSSLEVAIFADRRFVNMLAACDDTPATLSNEHTDN